MRWRRPTPRQQTYLYIRRYIITAHPASGVRPAGSQFGRRQTFVRRSADKVQGTRRTHTDHVWLTFPFWAVNSPPPVGNSAEPAGAGGSSASPRSRYSACRNSWRVRDKESIWRPGLCTIVAAGLVSSGMAFIETQKSASSYESGSSRSGSHGRGHGIGTGASRDSRHAYRSGPVADESCQPPQ